MGAGYGVQDVRGLVLRRGIEPEFAHGHVRPLVMQHVVAHGDRRQGLAAERTADAVRILGDSLEKDIADQLGDDLPHVAKHLFAIVDGLHRQAREYGQDVHDVVALPFLEFLAEDRRPVLGTAFPAVHVHVFDHASEDFRSDDFPQVADPGFHLEPDGLGIEAVAFQADGAAGGTVLGPVGGIAHAEDGPFAFRRIPFQGAVFRDEFGDIEELAPGDAVPAAYERLGRSRRDPPRLAVLALELVDAGVGLEVDFQDGEVFEGLGLVIVFVHHFSARGIVHEADPARGGLRDGVGEGRDDPAVPAEPGRLHAEHVAIVHAVVADLHDHAERLIVAVARADADAPHREGLFEFHVDVAGLRGIQRRRVAEIIEEGKVLAPVGSDLGPQVAGIDAVSRTGRIGESGNVPVIIAVGRGLGQLDADLRPALELHFAGGDDLHGHLRRDPGPAGHGPAVAGVEGELHAQPVCLAHGVTPDIPPFRSQLVVGGNDVRRVRDAPDRKLVGAAQAVFLHCFQVGGDAFTGEGPVHPVPEIPGAAGRRRVLPEALERLGLGCNAAEQQSCGKGGFQFHRTCIIWIPSRKDSFFSSPARWPMPMAQWCDGPALHHWSKKLRMPQGKE